MGFLFRVRMASFFAGAATASLAGFYLLYKDYMLAQDAIRRQVNTISQTVDERYESLNKRITALENQGAAAAAAAAAVAAAAAAAAADKMPEVSD